MPNVTTVTDSQTLDTTSAISTNTFGKISLLEDYYENTNTSEQEDSISTQTKDTTEIVLNQYEFDGFANNTNQVKEHSFAEFDDNVLRINYTKVGQMENGWIFWALLASLVVFFLTKMTFSKKISSLFNNVINYNFAQKEFQKFGENSMLLSFIMQCLFSFNMGLFILFATKNYLHFDIPIHQEIALTIIFSISVLVLYALKKVFFLTIAYIYDRTPYAQECVFNITLINRLLGICLYPIVIALAFLQPSLLSTNTLLIIGYTVITLFFLLRYFRELQISLTNHISLFYIFLYFCTLEILPLMLLAKLTSSIFFTELNIL